MKRNNTPGRQVEIHAWVEQGIYEGKFRPGDFIEEQMLCEVFNVSRTPVREALLQLASRRLVTFQPRKGAMVTKLSAKEIIAMWEVLAGLEVMCCELAARRMSEKEQYELEDIHQVCSNYAESNDIANYKVANREFHDLIHTACRNYYLVQQIWDLRLRLRNYGRRPYQRPGGIERSFEGHSRIVDAIRSGNTKDAGIAMGEHVSGGLSLLDFLAEASTDWTTEQKPEGADVQSETNASTSQIARSHKIYT